MLISPEKGLFSIFSISANNGTTMPNFEWEIRDGFLMLLPGFEPGFSEFSNQAILCFLE